MRGTSQCGAAGVLLASIEASPDRGRAPLTVDLTVSGETSDGSSLSSYSVDFGDGQSLNNQPFANGQNTARAFSRLCG